MLDVTTLKVEDLKGLSPEAVTELATVLLAQLGQLSDTQAKLGAQI